MSIDDIPEAFREKTDHKGNSLSFTLLILISTVMSAIALLLGIGLFRSQPSPSPVIVKVSPSPYSSVIPTPTPVENILGHLPYQQALDSDLSPITQDGRIRLRPAAAKEFKQMQADARRSGIILVPLSGFRTVEQQNYLFFTIKQQRNQDASKRAEVSAPPGYSEHHTGYAIDIGDGKAPATNLSQSFERTSAFQWLDKNAARYSFELSFPPDNPQGISYEPWHWRYVGDADSLETFYKAQQLKSPTEKE
ncbi:MAG: D-alanyl-D-alanine carboxypeptidase family protein [Microcystaceae cyanobacterium]